MNLRASDIQTSSQSEPSESSIAKEIRSPRVSDAAAMWQLVQDCGVLDTNSCYAYLLICRDFSETSLVAVSDGNLLGFVSAYIPPNRPDSLFVWQIGIAKSARRQGLAKQLLQSLLNLCVARQLRFIEATVTPSNVASSKLFRSIADESNSTFHELPGFEGADFGSMDDPTVSHEPEHLIRIELPEEKI